MSAIGPISSRPHPVAQKALPPMAHETDKSRGNSATSPAHQAREFALPNMRGIGEGGFGKITSAIARDLDLASILMLQARGSSAEPSQPEQSSAELI